MVPAGRRGRWRAAWARVAVASAQIVSGESLAEVVIAEEGKAACVIAFAGVEAEADGGEGGGEGPVTKKGGDAVIWNGEEEFIILSAGESELGSGAGGEGDLSGINSESDAGGAGEAREIGAESVAEVEHSGWELVADEPLAFGEAWGKGEMSAGPRATEFSCNKKKVARFGSATIGRKFMGNGAEKGNGEKELACADCLASDDGEVEFFGEKGESSIGLAEALGGAGVGATYGEEGSAGSGSSGGEIAEGTGEGFATDEGGGGGAGEVDAFDDGIGFENEIEFFRK